MFSRETTLKYDLWIREFIRFYQVLDTWNLVVVENQLLPFTSYIDQSLTNTEIGGPFLEGFISCTKFAEVECFIFYWAQIFQALLTEIKGK